MEKNGASFKVRFADVNGNVKEESVNANSREEAISLVRGRNLVPIKISEENAFSKDLNFTIKQRVRLSDLAVFCRQLSAMLGAGMPINRALDIQVSQTENLTLREVLQEVSNKIKQGEALSKSMREFPTVFPPILLSMLESGEATGNMDEVLERMADHYINENKIKNQITGAMVYPIILLFALVIVMAIVMLFVVPQFISIFEGGGTELPLITKIVIAISNTMTKYWFVYLGSILTIVIVISRYSKTTQGRYNLDKLKFELPIINKPMKQIITARFTRTLSTLLESGVSIINALTIAADTTGNVLVIDAIALASDGIKRGMSLTSELKKIEFFPLMMTSMVGIGEETGEIDVLLKKTAEYYDEELEAAIKKLLSLIEPAMILILGAVIGSVVVAIMLPMFTLNSGGVMGD